ncbi:MAG: hypothetical protein HY329_21475 [Chloroflexi bacterium]|nr:hypothetical protein [Chloroflexota bacterium]
MGKQGQHQNDAHDKSKSHGHNNPKKSVTITTGTYKKEETYHKQAAQHQDPFEQPQAAKNEWNEETRKEPTHDGSTRARDVRSGRSGSDSNES